MITSKKENKKFKMLIKTICDSEISSVANTDFYEKRWQKPLLIPLIKDVKMFRQETLKFAEDCVKKFCNNGDNEDTYKLLVQCTLSLTILFNRRRIRDVQYLKIKEYHSEKKKEFPGL